MQNIVTGNSATTNNTTKATHDFFLRLARTEAFFGIGYSLLLLYFGATFMSLLFLLLALALYPSVIYLSRVKYEVSARLLLICGGLFYIYSALAIVKFDAKTEYYYLPVMMLPLLLFDIRQKKELAIGISLPFFTWAMGRWGPLPALPLDWSPSNLPQEFFRNLNFIGALTITAICINYYRNFLIDLKEIVETDLADAKLTKQLLQDAQRMAKIGNWELDLINNRLLWSDEIFRIFEIDKNYFQASYEAFLALIHPEDRDVVNGAYINSLETRKPYEIVHRLLMPDGRLKFVREQCESDYDPDGNPIRSIGTIQDITESIKNDLALQHASKMASLGEMAAGIAHEINNPLAIIQGKANQVIRAVDMIDFDKEKVKTDTMKIISTVERISNIINSLRSISRNAEIDSGKPEDVQKILEEVLSLSRERFKCNSVELRQNIIDIPNQLQIICRPSEISQVILNLLNNAFDAVSPLDEKWVELKAVISGPNIKIVVIDSGNGIPQPILEKLMQPFFTTKEIGKGTGLGLSISKKIIEKHQGKLYYDIESKNTCFIVEIPISIVNPNTENISDYDKTLN